MSRLGPIKPLLRRLGDNALLAAVHEERTAVSHVRDGPPAGTPCAPSTRFLARAPLSSGFPRMPGSRGAILLHRRNNCYAPIGTGNGGGHTARFGLARGRSLRRRDCSLALPMPARI